MTSSTRENRILRGPRSSSFWIPRNLSHHMIRQARTGDTVLVKIREMTGRSQTLTHKPIFIFVIIVPCLGPVFSNSPIRIPLPPPITIWDMCHCAPSPYRITFLLDFSLDALHFFLFPAIFGQL